LYVKSPSARDKFSPPQICTMDAIGCFATEDGARHTTYDMPGGNARRNMADRMRQAWHANIHTARGTLVDAVDIARGHTNKRTHPTIPLRVRRRPLGARSYGKSE
jgi:hypothetical protein